MYSLYQINWGSTADKTFGGEDKKIIFSQHFALYLS